jgi:hypothetical protein
MNPPACGYAAALPPEGAQGCLGAARRSLPVNPHACGYAAALPPEGAEGCLGAARRSLA